MQHLTSIVILTLNELEYTQKCVRSIVQHTAGPYEFVFVDNGSTDGTVEWLRTLDNATVVANSENLGFGGGCNQGISAARGDQVLLLNNDTVVTPGWLEALQRGLDGDPARGIVGPRSNNVADVQKIENVSYDEWTLEGFDEFVSQRTEAIDPGSGFPFVRLIGFCMLVRREVIDAIGGFDVRFGLGNFEDDDFCLRAAVAGFNSWVCDDAFVHHFGSRTFAGTGIAYTASMDENWKKFQAKWNVPAVGDGAIKGYDPRAVLLSTTYHLATHYAPLVAVSYDDETAHFDRRDVAVLLAVEPSCADDLEEAFEAACAAYAASDPVSVVVRIDPVESEAAYGALERVADRHPEGIPDVVVVETSSLNDEAVVMASDLVIAHGRNAQAIAGIARLHNVASCGIDQLSTALPSAA